MQTAVHKKVRAQQFFDARKFNSKRMFGIVYEYFGTASNPKGYLVYVASEYIGRVVQSKRIFGMSGF